MLANVLGVLETLCRLDGVGEDRMIWMRTFACFACLGLIAYGLGAMTRDDPPQRPY